ncbi:MAG: MFS transporter, partial [Pseudomonadota bacterium]
SAALIPFMGVFIVEVLEQEPWMISLYAAITLTLTLGVNRHFGERIDRGVRIAPMVLLSICAFVLGVSAILVVWNYTILLLVAAPCFALSNGAVSTMYSFGRLSAERNGWNIERFNSYLRATTSLGWMISPAVAFMVADAFGAQAVFLAALSLAVIWAMIWWRVMPKSFAGQPTQKSDQRDSDKNGVQVGLWGAAAVCLCFSLAHVMTASALPLFYIREAGLPVFSAGLSFSIKTFVEILAILSTPWILSRLGIHNSLCLAAAVALAAFLVLSQVSSLPMLVSGAALEGLYYGLFAAVGLLYVQGFAHGRLGRATSLYMNSLFLGALLASPLMGSIAQFFSFRTVIQISALPIFAAVIALVLLRARHNATSRP